MGSRQDRISYQGAPFSGCAITHCVNSCAVQLLDHEPRSSDQVPLLLSMKEDRLALEKAVESGDTDLGISAVCLPHVRC